MHVLGRLDEHRQCLAGAGHDLVRAALEEGVEATSTLEPSTGDARALRSHRSDELDLCSRRSGGELLPQGSALFADPARACLVAAILPGTEAGFSYRWIRRDAGFDVGTTQSRQHVGWFSEYNPEILEALQVSERVVRSTAELSWFLEAVHPRILNLALRFVEARRQAHLVYVAGERA